MSREDHKRSLQNAPLTSPTRRQRRVEAKIRVMVLPATRRRQRQTQKRATPPPGDRCSMKQVREKPSSTPYHNAEIVRATYPLPLSPSWSRACPVPRRAAQLRWARARLKHALAGVRLLATWPVRTPLRGSPQTTSLSTAVQARPFARPGTGSPLRPPGLAKCARSALA
jgi:hypothetical protein